MNNIVKKLISTNILILFVFLFNVSSVLAARTDFKPGSTTGGNVKKENDTYTLSCANVKMEFKILEVSDNNEKQGDCGSDGGIFWDATDSSRVRKLTKEASQDGKNHYILWGHSVTCGTTKKITLSINNSTTGKSCEGTISVNPDDNFGNLMENSSFKFDLKVSTEKTQTKESFTSKINVDVVNYGGVCGTDGEKIGDYAIDLNDTTEEIAKAMTDYSHSESEEDKKKAEEVRKEVVKYSGSSVNVPIPDATSINGANVGTSQKLECDDSLASFIRKYWKYVMLFAPILLMVLVTLDFFKALFSSDSELVKKASDNAVKRVIAALLLLCLPLIIQTILGFFGLELCI